MSTVLEWADLFPQLDLTYRPFANNHFRGSPIADLERHHLISNASANESFLLRAIQLLSDSGALPARSIYDHNDFDANGIALSTDKEKSTERGTAWHGDHTVYREQLVSPALAIVDKEVLNDLRDQHGALMRSGLLYEDAAAQLRADQANLAATFERHAPKVKGLQAFLHNGLIASNIPGENRVRPKLALSSNDPYVGGRNLVSEYEALLANGMQAIRSSFAFQAGVAGGYKRLAGAHDLRNAAGELVSASERAGHQYDDFGIEAARSGARGRAALMSLLENTSSRVRPGLAGTLSFTAVTISIGVWVKEQVDAGRSWDDIFADLKAAITPSQLLQAGIVTTVGAIGVVAVSTFLGPAGAAALLALDVGMSFADLRQSLKGLQMAMPNWTFLADLNGLIDTVWETAGYVIDRVFGDISDLMPNVAIADGVTDATGREGIDLMAGNQDAVLRGGAGGDWLLHFGSGEVHGGAGNDRIFGIGSEYSETPDAAGQPQRLDLYGDDGNDLLAFFMGAGGVAKGGAGNDALWGGGQESHLWGGEGQDKFFIGANTNIHDGEHGDTVYMGPIPLYGGVKQWWMEGQQAYWSPFSGLMTAFPVIGSELLYTASFFIDQVTMKFATYEKGADGNLQVNIGWGFGGKAIIYDHDVDLDTGRSTAGVTVFATGAGRSKNAERHRRFVNLALYAGFGSGLPGYDPLVLDLNGDGLSLTTEANSRTWFDYDSDGFAEHTGWVRGSDGLLARDLNSNGRIDNQSELFGNAGVGGFEMLGESDQNADGSIDSDDAVFDELRVWRDLNQDGASGPGELQTLQELGIVSISLSAVAPAEPSFVAGNQILRSGRFIWTDGRAGTIGDIAFTVNPSITRWVGDDTVSAEAQALPQLNGLGLLKHLRHAMTEDLQLRQMVESFAHSTETDLGAFKSGAEQILYRWAAVQDIAAVPIGQNGFDARKLAFLEKQANLQLMPRGAGGAPLLDNLDEVEALWNDQLSRLTLRLVVQGPMAQAFHGVSFNEDLDLLVVADAQALSRVLGGFLASLPGEPQDARTIWASLAPLLGAVSDGMVRADANLVREDYLFAQLIAAMDGVTQPLPLDELAAGLSLPVRMGTGSGEVLRRDGAGGTLIFAPQGGSDQLVGGIGQDVYVFGRTIGQTVIDDVESSAAGDRIRFAFHTPADVKLVRAGNDLLITVTATNETIRVAGQFAPVVAIGSDVLLSPNRGVEDIQFADGAIWEIPQIMAAIGTGTAGDDHILGTMHSDVLLGEGGDDRLEGGDDADLYVLKAGGGHDVIRDAQSTPLLRAADMLIFNEGLRPEAIRFSRAGANGDDLLITTGPDSSVLIEGQFAYSVLGYNAALAPNTRIEMFAFKDFGDAWGHVDIQTKLIRGTITVGDDVILGFGDDDSFASSKGDDLMIGVDGADIYHWAQGAGNDVIDERSRFIDVNVGMGGLSLGVKADTVLFDASIARENLIFSRLSAAPDLTVTNALTGETLTVRNQFAGFQTGVLGAQWLDRIEWFEFADGVRLSWQDVIAKVTKGTAANEGVWGDLTNDTLEGYAGNDYLSGRGYGDTYVFELGYGHDTLDDANDSFLGEGFVTIDGDPDILRLGEGITSSQVGFARNGADFDLIVNESDRITLKGQDSYIQTGIFGALSVSRIEEIRFAGGEVWTWSDLNRRALAAATTSGNDVAQGFTFEDRFEASAGDDTLRGGESGDTYVFGVGSGQDRIEETVSNVLYGDDDVLEFGSGIAPEDVTLSRAGSDLILTLASGDTMRVVGQFNYYVGYRWNDIELFTFANGATWTDADIRVKLTQGSAGDDHIIGFDSYDVLDGCTGADVLEGGDGGDTYKFGRGYGHDRIREYVAFANLGDDDRLVFGPDITLSDLGFSRDGNDLIVTISGTSDMIRIEGQYNYYLGYEWNDVETFHFADGTSISDAQVRSILLQGTSGADIVRGFRSDDVLSGEAGDDQLYGGDGSDTYRFNLGFGHDNVREEVNFVAIGDNDAIEFGTGIAPSDIDVSREGDDVILTVATSGDSVRIVGQLEGSEIGFSWKDIEIVRFADGTAWSKLQLGAMTIKPTGGDDLLLGTNEGDVIAGGEGNDTINGNAGNDTMSGGAGNDVVRGWTGDDLYLYNAGDGDDVFDENSPPWGSVDTIRLSAGIAPADLILRPASAGSSDLEITFSNQPGSIIVKEQLLGSSAWGVERLEFADGSAWSREELANRLVSGAATDGDDVINGTNGSDQIFGGLGNDQLHGHEGDDLLDGGGGDDFLSGWYGADTYRYAAGGGHDFVSDFAYVWGSFDTLELGSGISASSLRFARATADISDLVITFDGLPGSVTLDNQLDHGADWGIDRIKFAEGTSISADELNARLFAAQATDGDNVIIGSWRDDLILGDLGNDELHGGHGNDTLDGGGGNDVLYGWYGAETYRYSPGGGDDFVSDFAYVWGSFDTIEFASGIAPSALRFARSTVDPSDMIITFGGIAGSITIDNQLEHGADWGIDQLKFSDGPVLTTDEMNARLFASLSTAGDDVINGSWRIDHLTGGAGNDLIRGHDGADTLDGGPGDDRLEGGAWHDTYVYALGGGHDVVSEFNYVWGSNDVLRLGAGILPAGVTVSQDGTDASDLVLTFTDGGSITIDNQLYGGVEWGIDTVQFANGEAWTFAQMRAGLILATNGNDSIAGTEGPDSFRGVAGDDVLSGLSGDDKLLGDLGNDQLKGGLGADKLDGGFGDDILEGGDGTDTLSGSAGSDMIYGDLRGPQGTGPNLIVNGGFEQSTTTIGHLQWSMESSSIPGWSQAPGNTHPYQHTLGGAFGIYPTEGTYWMELHSRGGEGSNMDISQTVSGLNAGQAYVLSFDYANSTNPDDGAFDVFWNGAKLETLAAPSNGMRFTSYQVTAAPGTNTVRFVGLGSPYNYAGAALDNVSLQASAAPATATGDDVLDGGGGNDTLDGGAGFDVVRLTGLQSGYQLIANNGVLSIVDIAVSDGDDGTDRLIGIESLLFGDGQTVSITSPIVLDLDRNGVTHVGAKASKARFDLDSDGVPDRSDWIGKGDAFLFLDRDGNGTLTDVQELSFTSDKPGALSDLDGLKNFDSNGDSELSQADALFGSFKVWRDRNGDGQVAKREVIALGDAGVRSLSLIGSPTSGAWAPGEAITLNTGSFTRIDGSTGAFADVALTYAGSRKSSLPAQSEGAQRAQLSAQQLIEAASVFAPEAAAWASKHDLDQRRDMWAFARSGIERQHVRIA